ASTAFIPANAEGRDPCGPRPSGSLLSSAVELVDAGGHRVLDLVRRGELRLILLDEVAVLLEDALGAVETGGGDVLDPELVAGHVDTIDGRAQGLELGDSRVIPRGHRLDVRRAEDELALLRGAEELDARRALVADLPDLDRGTRVQLSADLVDDRLDVVRERVVVVLRPV